MFLIEQYVQELRKSKLYRCCWAVHRPLCEDIEVSDNCFFDCDLITVPRE